MDVFSGMEDGFQCVIVEVEGSYEDDVWFPFSRRKICDTNAVRLMKRTKRIQRFELHECEHYKDFECRSRVKEGKPE